MDFGDEERAGRGGAGAAQSQWWGKGVYTDVCAISSAGLHAYKSIMWLIDITSVYESLQANTAFCACRLFYLFRRN